MLNDTHVTTSYPFTTFNHHIHTKAYTIYMQQAILKLSPRNRHSYITSLFFVVK